MKRYILRSSPLFHTPGIIAWAINAYNFEQASMESLLCEGYKLPLEAAVALLSGEVPYTVDGDSVTFEISEQ